MSNTPPRRPRGHWPAGKLRKPPTGIAVVRALKSLIAANGLRPTARALQVDPRTVSRWAKEERFPDAEEAKRIRELPRDADGRIIANGN